MKMSEIKVGEAYAFQKSKYDTPLKATVLAVSVTKRPENIPPYLDDRPRSGWSGDRVSGKGILVNVEGNGKRAAHERLTVARALVWTWAEQEKADESRRVYLADLAAKRTESTRTAEALVRALDRIGIKATTRAGWGYRRDHVTTVEVVLDAEAQRAVTAQLEELSARREKDTAEVAG